VGGNRRAKVAIEEALALDVVRRRRLGALGLSPPTGILLYGPPGVGKTLLAKAVSVLLRRSDAKAINAPAYVGGGMFISLNSSDLVRAEVGASEKMVMEAFENARANAPAVVFIDEFQALFVDRNTGGNSRTMTTALLECMDDVRKWSDVDIAAHLTQEGSTAVSTTDLGRRVVVLAATNTPWMIDRAFLRPGRFDRAVHVGLPTQDERASILRVHVGRMRTSFAVARPALAESFTIFCDELAAATNGFSGADLAALCRAAAVRCLLESGSNVVQERHFLEALEGDVQPSTSEEYVRRIEQWKLRGMRGGC
jgi:SpoVK/Ycf46/Vps4 family AAA+-type ATPase